MSYFFRVDASIELGNGHVTRCLALAKSLKKYEIISTFICRKLDGHLIDFVRTEGFDVEELVCPNVDGILLNTDNNDLTNSRRNTSLIRQEQDARKTIDILKNKKVDWLIVDHYELDRSWEYELRPFVGKIMVIDDLADREHECDLLLDQNLTSAKESRYDALIPKNARRLFGPHYALLDSIYAAVRHFAVPRKAPVRQILVFLGGSDPHNVTDLVFSSLLALNRNDLSINIVLGSNNPKKSSMRDRAENYPNTTVYDSIPNLAQLMLTADLSIGAGGVTSWERCCLGLPSIVISTADNQRMICEELHRHDLVYWVGHHDSLTIEKLSDSLRVLLDNEALEDFSKNCMEVTDGLGACRVASALQLNRATALKARRARTSDSRIFSSYEKSYRHFNLQNETDAELDARVELQLYRWLRDFDKTKLYIVETSAGLPVGAVIFILSDEIWQIDYVILSAAISLDLHDSILESVIRAFQGSSATPIEYRRLMLVKGLFLRQSKPIESNYRKANTTLLIDVCSDKKSWMNDEIPRLVAQVLCDGHSCFWVHNSDLLAGGNICFLLSYSRLVQSEIRAKYNNTLVVHASELPAGKGWSPASWLILDGKKTIPVTLLEAIDEVDSGPIYDQKWVDLKSTDLSNDWRKKIAHISVALVINFIRNFPQSSRTKREQLGTVSYYPKRTAKDSKLDPHKTINEQFNLLRISDNDNYPAFFELEGCVFELKIFRKVS